MRCFQSFQRLSSRASASTAVASLLGGALTGFTERTTPEDTAKWGGAGMGGMVLADKY